MRKIIFIFIFFYLLIFNALSQKINIGIYNEQKIKSFTFTPESGAYNLLVDTTIIMVISKGNAIQFNYSGDSITIKLKEKKIGTYKYLLISGTSKINCFKIKPLIPSYNLRTYDDDLYLSVYQSKLQIVNKVEMDNYIAGVVESEGGAKANIEYYKSQAIICRTYALMNINKHIGESFNLCDNVHCQSYIGKCKTNTDIINAAKFTTGLVIVDTTLSLISATFHSNCGGETAFSEDVWTKPRSYLKSVSDPFCIKSAYSQWEKIITLDKWKKYLIKNGFKIKDSVSNPDYFSFTQLHRTMYYKLKNDSIPLTKIRADLNLRSTYFSVEPKGNDIILKGKGYGHGVGLCQIGAMQMAASGYKYMDIIKYYYKNIYIVSTRALQFGK